MGAFCEGVYWEVLKADDQPVEEPANINFKRARATIILEEDCIYVPVKHNFSNNKFDVPQFQGKVKRVVRWVNGVVKKIRKENFLWKILILVLDVQI